MLFSKDLTILLITLTAYIGLVNHRFYFHWLISLQFFSEHKRGVNPSKQTLHGTAWVILGYCKF